MAKKTWSRGNTGKRGVNIVAEMAARYGLKAPAERPKSEQYITPNQAGRILGVTGEAVKQWIYHRRLPATKLSNGYWKIKVADLEEFLKSRQNHDHKRIMIIGNAGPRIDEMIQVVKGLGHEPVVAHNALDAMLKATDLYPSLFIVDISSPGAWGLVGKFRETRNIKTLPILIVSDHDLKESESDRALSLGVQGFLRKPFKPDSAAQEIEKLLSRIL